MTISLRLFAIAACMLCCIQKSSAEGSKELAANGGNRALWRSSTTSTSQFPYPYLGIIKVYARAGESIYLGSSAQGIVGTGAGGRLATINWRAPDGATGTSGADAGIGRIQNRAEEVAGPRLVTNGPGPGYNPYIVTVGAGQEGIWEITFVSSNNTAAGGTPPVIDANASWTQNPNSWYISAFDVSVRNDANTAFVNGRAFLNMYAGSTSSVGTNFGSFNGIFHILTRDGYRYTVNANGMQGVAFDFFVNNKGFRDASGNAVYKSVAGIGTTPANIPVHDPTTPDDATNVTHKLFFNSPNADLPAGAGIPGGGTDWLAATPLTSSLSNFAFTGIEGTPNRAGTSPLGGSFTFDATNTGSFIISLDIDQNGVFTDVRDRQLTGSAATGANTVPWDGMDGEGIPVPGGMVFQPGTIRIEMLGGEVHFPLLDVERNPNGIIVTRVNGAGAPDDVLYWDDSDIVPPPGSVPSSPVFNLSGQSSTTNGHIWNLNFGNDNGMDSWAYIPSAPLTNSAPVAIRAADLRIVSIAPTPAALCVGTQVSYRVTVRNEGPSAVTNAPFAFTYPAELTGVTVTNVNTQDTLVVTSETNTPGQYTALLTSGNTGEIVFTITGTAATIPAGGNLVTTAGIMRTADITDPDATNPDASPPADPQAECDAAPSGPGCNNMLSSTVTVSAPIANNTIAAAQTICPGATPATLTGSAAGGGNGSFAYAWESSTTDGATGFSAAPGVNSGQDYTPPALTATTWFRRTVTSGCTSASPPLEITVEQVAAPAATAVQPTCAVGAGSITVTAVAGLTYSINGTDYQPGNTFSNVAPGTYQVTAKSAGGCTSAATQVVIDPQPATPAAPGVANLTYCQGDAAAALTANGTQIKWYAAASGGTALPQPVTPLTTNPGATTYWASQTNAAGCESERAAVTVTVFAKPALQITSSTAEMEVTDPRRELTANVAGGTFTGPGVVAESGRFYFNPATAGPGIHSVTYTYNSGGACTSTTAVSIRVSAQEADLVISIQPETRPVSVGDPFTYTITVGNNGPGTATNVAVATPLPTVVEYVSVTADAGTAEYNAPGNNITWNIGTLPPNIIQTMVITVKPEQLGVIENTATISSSQPDNTPGNNTAVAAKEIVGLKIPNVITPNGDGYNDRFVIKGLELFPQNQLTIINRWGNHVYEQKNYSNTWDGNGLLEGTYFYILRLTDAQGKKLDYKGYLMITR